MTYSQSGLEFLDFLDGDAESVPKSEGLAFTSGGRGKRARSEEKEGAWRVPSAPRALPRTQPQSGESVCSEEALTIPQETAGKLFEYQKEGVDWLYRRHREGCGCVLADEMGLGKTVQVAAFLGAMARAGNLKTILIVVPGTLMQLWADALVQWGMLPTAAVEVIHKGARASRLKRWQRFRHGTFFAAITTYGIAKSDGAELSKITLDYIVLDEAHLIKDPSSETFKSVKMLQSVHRIAITGTPIMNNFGELWALLNFVDENILSCSRSEFSAVNSDILKGNEKDATASERSNGGKILDSLRHKIALFILRREKTSLGIGGKKEEFVLWVRMAEAQLNQYNAFLESDTVKVALRSINTSQPLVLLTALKRICDHPWLNFNERNFLEAMTKPDELFQQFLDFGDIQSGPKLRVAAKLISEHRGHGKRTLVFSRSKRLLLMLEHLLRIDRISFVRFDGDTPMPERSSAIKSFNEGSAWVCLATTQVGGVGVTFNGASRVILLDPSWNPASDAQAVDRVHRIGQSEDVLVYRLVTGNSVDEKVYRNQVFKMMAARQIHANDSESSFHRYFTHTQLRNMFEEASFGICETAQQLREIHPECLADALVHSLQGLLGEDLLDVSSHTAIFTQTCMSDEAPGARPRRQRMPRKRTPTPPPPQLISNCELANETDQNLDCATDLLANTCEGLRPTVKNEGNDIVVDYEAAKTLSIPLKARCTIFNEDNAGAIQDRDCADALVMVRGIKFARIHMSEVHRGSIALDVNEYMLDSCSDEDGVRTPENFRADWMSPSGIDEWGEASNPADSGCVSEAEDF